ncbi:hypothetical protein [Gracilibacillus suaedae]|uniref:hypothetical protein n=1 Tax=Gracilibacillus suaedae TaxID=2820273 RepID=UPI001ABED28A|nr:hypothetical protein [Gracilibacillus suaedae]
MMNSDKERRFKIRTFYDVDMRQRAIHILDRTNGHTFLYYEDEVEDLIRNESLHLLGKYLKRRFHLIRNGAYDKAPTQK